MRAKLTFPLSVAFAAAFAAQFEGMVVTRWASDRSSACSSPSPAGACSLNSTVSFLAGTFFAVETLARAKPGRPPVGVASERLGLCTLTEPTLRLPVEKHDCVLAAREHNVEVAAVDRLLCPPAVDDAPLLTHERDLLPVHGAWRAVEVRLHERNSRRVQSSRGTSSALCSGIRDQGATSTTEHTAPEPAPARTCIRPSRRWARS